ncbi:hypothetical protein ERO13_D06G016150v2 [Gossypium hirsutum]|uniref:EF-hand domain-containing protein n=2 Tax=Gossypium TaxID=3633 RepID=A0A5D2KEA4_GOSTO|nr:hypothetical protein ERO13_D06G016150v2 [Gossypium hirsutum]TYG63318.1 hypothetical protein ES288_D06G020300v1 [Gossypium darwinii]TYH64946.1 hypothetical protein ES332_D06G022200v1 [Gossypium tomentosum]
MTMDEFKQWLKKFDADNDGRISKEEFLSAIYETGGQFAWCKSRRAIKSADADGSGFIEENENNTRFKQIFCISHIICPQPQ